MPTGWLIGVAINQNQSDGRDAAAVELVTSHFNAISPENLLKFQSVQPQPGAFTFDAQDRYVAFGRDRGMAVIGHTLVWHSQTPAWVWAGHDGGLADRATMLERMRTHITTLVGRYKGRIRGWDVVNEALNDDGTLRDSPWRRGIGDDYIAQAFAFARQADPDAELYYNDYNLATRPEKRAGAIRIDPGPAAARASDRRGRRAGPLAARVADDGGDRPDHQRSARHRPQGDDHGAGREPAAAGRAADAGSQPLTAANPYANGCRTTCSRRSRAATPTPSASF